MHFDDLKRSELLQELPLLMASVQQLGQGLVNTSHGSMHHHAREFNDFLRQARIKLDQLQAISEDMAEEVAVQEVQVSVQFIPRYF